MVPLNHAAFTMTTDSPTEDTKDADLSQNERWEGDYRDDLSDIRYERWKQDGLDNEQESEHQETNNEIDLQELGQKGPADGSP